MDRIHGGSSSPPPSDSGDGNQSPSIPGPVDRISHVASSILSTASSTELGYEQIVEQWVERAEANVQEDYRQAQQTILSFLRNKESSKISFSKLAIKDLPDIWNHPACKERLTQLEIKDCPEIEDIPTGVGNCTALKNFILINCIKLVTLPESIGNCRALYNLNFRGCTSFVALPESIGNCRALYMISLDNCISFETLPESIGNCTALYIIALNNCIKLVTLPGSIGNCTALHTISLDNSTSFRGFPESIGKCIGLKALHLANCISFETLPESIGNCTVLRTLILSNCTSFRVLSESIGNCIALRSINLEHTALTEIPSSLLQLHQECTIDLRGCPLSSASQQWLRQVINWPSPTTPHFELDPTLLLRIEKSRDTFYLSLEEVQKNPETHLGAIFKKGLPSKIIVLDKGIESPAIDLGGVTKQFVTSLCRALLSKEILPLQGLPKSAPKKEAVFMYLGRLISLIYAANISKSDKLLTGYLFDTNFLEMVKAIATASDKETGFKHVCTIVKAQDPSLSTSADLVIEPTLEHKNAYLTILGEEPASKLLPDDPTVNEAREYLTPFYQAAESFCEGLIEPFKTALCTQELNGLSSSFQGNSVTIEGVVKAIDSQGGAFSPKSQEIIRVFAQEDLSVKQALLEKLHQEQELQPSSAAFTDKVEWLLEALVTSDQTWLEQFVFAVTGKRALLPGMTIQLKPDDRDTPTFEIHTCFNSLTLPKGTFRRGDFIEALKEATKGDNYNIR